MYIRNCKAVTLWSIWNFVSWQLSSVFTQILTKILCRFEQSLHWWMSECLYVEDLLFVEPTFLCSGFLNYPFGYCFKLYLLSSHLQLRPAHLQHPLSSYYTKKEMPFNSCPDQTSLFHQIISLDSLTSSPPFLPNFTSPMFPYTPSEATSLRGWLESS